MNEETTKIEETTMNEKTAKKEKNIKKEILSYVRVIAIAVVCGLIINYTIIASAHVVSGSMENTIMTDSRVMGLRLTYLVSKPNRFDIILFHPPEGEVSEHPYIKRIIGLPNEKIEIIDGKVYINDSTTPLEEDYVKDIAHGSFGPFEIPENSYFVMGDNRNGSSDSRHWINSFVTKKSIIAKLYLEYFPSPHFLD